MHKYRHSGKIPIGSIPAMLITGGSASIILGLAYGHLRVIAGISFGYAFLTAALGGAIGVAVYLGAITGNMRNERAAGAYGILFGFLALYVAWGVDFSVRSHLELSLKAFSPGVILEHIKHFYANGVIASGHLRGTPLSGTYLASIWIAEAGWIIGAAAVIPFVWIASTPFCENCVCWTNSQGNCRHFAFPEDVQDLLTQIDQGHFEAISRLASAGADQKTFLQVSGACCPKCHGDGFLTIQRVKYTPNGNHKPHIAKKTLRKNLVVSRNIMLTLLGVGESKPESKPSRS